MAVTLLPGSAKDVEITASYDEAHMLWVMNIVKTAH